MRSSSKSIFSCGALSALASLAVVVSSGTLVAQTEESPTVAPRTDGDTGESVSPWTRQLELSSLAIPQGDDYSVEGLFSRLHGKYMVDRRRFEPNVEIWGGYQGTAGLSGESGKFSFGEVGFRSEYELPVDPDTFLIKGGLFTMRRYDMEMQTGVSDTSLYQTFLTMGMGRFINEDFLVEARFQPGLTTDFGGTLRSDDWKFYGDVVGTYRTNEQLYWKVGVRVDNTFEGTPVYPVLGVSFLIDEAWRFDILAPTYAELAWMPNAAFVLKGGLSLQGEEYAYRDAVSGTNHENLNWRTQEFRLYADGAWRLSDQFSLSARLGATLAGKYDIQRVGGAPAYAGQVDPTFFGQIAFGFSF